VADTTTFEATIEQTQPMTVALQAFEGSYDLIPQGFQRLYGWIGPRGHSVTGPPMGVYLTSPPTPDAPARFEVWVPIEDAATVFGPDESGLGIRQVDAMDVARTRHVGPYDQIGRTYAKLQQWIADHKYEIAGPPMEIYLSPPDTPPEKITTEILIPVHEK